MMNTAPDDWRTFEGNKIPTKGIKLPQLFFDTLTNLEEAQEDDDDENVISSSGEEQKQASSLSLSSNKVRRRKRKLQILELGCGCGELSSYLYNNRGHDVTGIDINQEAIEIAQRLCPNATFYVEDITNTNISNSSSNNNSNSNISSQKNTNIDIIKNNDDDKDSSSSADECYYYDFVILQLVLSIVGNIEQRVQTLHYAISKLRPGSGILYLSCSGVSDTINESYRRLYEDDYVSTNERYTYYSRHPTSNEILYTTHHFTIDELKSLLLLSSSQYKSSSSSSSSNADNTKPEIHDDGDDDNKIGRLLEDIHIEQIKEASSRRPNEAAYFLYATAKSKKKDPK